MLFNLNVFQFTGDCVQSATLSIAVNTPVHKVFGMFTDMYKLSQWGMQKAGNRHIKLNNTIFVIADEESDTYIEWRYVNSDGYLAYSLSFTLSVANGRTLLNFNKQYWQPGGGDYTDGIDWQKLLLTLKAWCERAPEKPVLKIASIF